MDYKVIDYQVSGRSAVITLDRPERGNAWTGRVHAEYLHAVGRADTDPAIRTIVVTGRGWAFCVGGDSDALAGHVERGSYDDGLARADGDVADMPGAAVDSQFDHQFAFHYGLTKPVIAAINGPAAGIGLALACFADLRFAVPGAKLTTAHGKLGLPPEYGLSWILPRHVGLTRAMELLLTSRVFLTDEAHRIGLVNQLVPADELLETVLAYAEDLATANSPSAVTATRHMVYLDQHRGIGDSVVDSLERLNLMMGSPEYRQGVEALRHKQPPAF
ncbi:MAG: enoyl-CoA hydratase-related protein [Acidimicrobiia bacterium]|nr:enoyl-CoA hydratase-related protein [Acidimicrobiia bacterium]